MLINKQRLCLGCKTFIGNRHPKSVRCRKCQRAYDKEYNSGYIRRKVEQARQQERRRILEDASQEAGLCMKCGSVECAVCWEDLKKSISEGEK